MITVTSYDGRVPNSELLAEVDGAVVHVKYPAGCLKEALTHIPKGNPHYISHYSAAPQQTWWFMRTMGPEEIAKDRDYHKVLQEDMPKVLQLYMLLMGI